MAIEIKVPRAVQIRRLAERHAYLSDSDIAKLTGYSLAVVRNALQAGNSGISVKK